MCIVMMSRSTHQIIVFLVLTIYLADSLASSYSGDGEPQIRCKEAERQSLLKIKDDLQDEEGLLSSWRKREENRECCEWIGIRCDNKTGHVISLDLSPSAFDRGDYYPSILKGNISSSLVELEYLNYLDLSFVEFYYNSIPSFIGSFSRLRYLNLSHTYLSGEVPPQLGNLSSLQVLDLNNNDNLEIKDLDWASRLSSLKVLDLSSINMSRAHDWVQVVNNLPFLTKLVLSDCYLPDAVASHLSLVNSSKTLSFLALSQNHNVSASIFQWLFNYNHTLVHLDLSSCSIKTTIPVSFGNMAALEYLDLSFNQFEGSVPVFFGRMASLTHLNLADNQLEGFIPESFGHMNSLVDLNLKDNQLEGSIPQSFGNMSALEILDLSRNMLEGEVPKSIWQICTLQNLQASGNNLSGELHLPESPSKCTHFSLEYLDLSENRLTGSLPNFTLYSSLVALQLGSNQLNGNISKSIGQLSKLEALDVSGNNIKTVVSEAHFSKLFNLSYLDLSSNSDIVFHIPSDWRPPFQMVNINLRSCKLGPHFPNWLQTQTMFSELDISNSGISDSIPEFIPGWLWNLTPSKYRSIYMSNNEIRGTIQDDKLRHLYSIGRNPIDLDLSSNQLEGPIPLSFLYMVSSLDLSNNRFTELNSICDLKLANFLKFLDVSSNQLMGELPDCWSRAEWLEVLRLSNNKLTGKIPVSLGFLTEIWSLHLSNNSLTAELPLSLKNLTRLKVLNVGENNLSGHVPTWIGQELPNIVVLSLRSNNFHGSIPSQLCLLQDLQVLDLSSNNLSSTIPTCLGNVTAMKRIGRLDPDIGSPKSNPYLRKKRYSISTIKPKPYNDKLPLVWKGVENEFRNLGLLKSIDLSNNKLVGEIRREITDLIGLNSLNLSTNNLSGQIPQQIGQLEFLDVLDLSRNHLSGQIPSSLSQIDGLGVLDLSSNNLSGKIPTGTQLQRRNATYYMDNPELCGAPLPKNCSDGEAPAEDGHVDKEEPTPHGTSEDGKENQEDEDDFITKGFYVCAAIGFIVGFWGFCATLIFHKSWRYRYLKFLESKGDLIYVILAVHKTKLLRIIKS